MATQNFKNLIISFKEEDRPQVVRNLLTCFSDTGFLSNSSEEYQAAMSEIVERSRSATMTSESAEGEKGPFIRRLFSKRKDSGSQENINASFSRALELLATIQSPSRSTISENERDRNQRLCELRDSGYIYGAHGDGKNVSYRGYEVVSTGLKALNNIVLDLRHNFRFGSLSDLGVFNTVIATVVGSALDLVAAVCKKLVSYPTYGPKYLMFINDAYQVILTIQNVPFQDERSLAECPDDLSRACKELKRIYEQIESGDPPEASSMDGKTRIEAHDISQEELSNYEILNRLLTSEDKCALPVINGKQGPRIDGGGFSDVYELITVDQVVAVKRIVSSGDIESWRAPLRILREAEMCKRASDDSKGGQYSIQLLGIWLREQDSLPGLVMELADGGNLEKYARKDCCTVKDRLDRSFEVLQGVKFLHDLSPRVIHGDLKTNNILVVKGRARISDFGLSKVAIDNTGLTTRTKPYSGFYRAPELYFRTERHPTVESDIYAYSCVFLEVLSGTPLFGGNEDTYKGIMGKHGSPLHKLPKTNTGSGLEVMTPKLFNKEPTQAQEFEERYIAMMEKCFNFHAENRPTAEQLVEEVQGFL